jgi:hypothetical protein
VIVLQVFQDAESVVCHVSLSLMTLTTSTTATTVSATTLEQLYFADGSQAFGVWFLYMVSSYFDH